MTHTIAIRVYYEDTDAGGVVYYANYLKFAERARTEFLREAGFENKSLRDDKGILLVVRHMEADYLKPARLDDLLRVETSVESMKNTYMVMKQSIFRENDLLFSMDVKLACIAAEGFKPVVFPVELKKGFEDHIANAR
ncbi:MAG TPA: tol-pal system-associated acyl-CoA thioesterase [Rhodospirillaceae bacterium]|nr:tol-pal system-associated acyl-CoA thioesterase [Rhodospirillaceae bacterium]